MTLAFTKKLDLGRKKRQRKISVQSGKKRTQKVFTKKGYLWLSIIISRPVVQWYMYMDVMQWLKRFRQEPISRYMLLNYPLNYAFFAFVALILMNKSFNPSAAHNFIIPKGYYIFYTLNPFIGCTSASTITITMSADTLSPKSRDFFERSKMKQTLSMTFAGIGLLFLGMTCEDGGMSNASTILEDTTTGDAEDSLAALSSGYGFSCFFKLLASILSFGVSLYFSSFLCG